MVLPGSLLLQARTNGYPEMVLDKSIRKTFLKELIRFCKKYNLDGACKANRTFVDTGWVAARRRAGSAGSRLNGDEVQQGESVSE